MSALDRRLQELLDERETLEKARLAIASGLPVPELAMRYVTARTGQSGETLQGDSIREWFDARLTEIDRQLRLFPVALFRRSSSIVQVTGEDLSQFAPNPTT